eukprot:COSAG02_NODE_2273_length_9263_cov_10.296377_2_plen_80_part_00
MSKRIGKLLRLVDYLSIFTLIALVVRMWFEYFVPTDENVTDLLSVVVAAREYAPLNQRNPVIRCAKSASACQASVFCST